MQRYSSYKDSSVKWIGEIPEGWEVRKTLFCLSMPITDGPHETPQLHEDGIPFVSAEAVSCGNGRIDFDYIRGYISKEFYNECCKKYIPKLHDIYMIKSGATTGKVALVDTDRIFTIWSPLAVFRCDESIMYYDYMFYVLQSTLYQQQVQLGWSYGTQQNIGMRTLEKLKVPVPPLNEQQEIASFLDNIVGKIDEIIAQQQKMIDLLNERKQIIINNAVTKGLDPNVKMKDSGVDWIGEIPEGWEVRKAKLCVTISNGSDPKLEGDIPVYGSGSSSFRTCGEYKEGPCVLIGRKGATLHIPHYIEGRYWNVDTAFDVKAKDGILLKFYYYLATCFDYQFYMSQTTLPSMTSFDYNRMKLPLPPINEQKEILENLEKKLCFFNNAISSIEKQITLLQERKQIIINDVVTGKVKVS